MNKLDPFLMCVTKKAVSYLHTSGHWVCLLFETVCLELNTRGGFQLMYSFDGHEFARLPSSDRPLHGASRRTLFLLDDSRLSHRFSGLSTRIGRCDRSSRESKGTHRSIHQLFLLMVHTFVFRTFLKNQIWRPLRQVIV